MIGSVRRMFRASTLVALGAGFFFGSAMGLSAQEASGVVKSPNFTGLVKTKGTKDWTLVKGGSTIQPGDTVLAGSRMVVAAPDGDVTLDFRGDVAGISPLSIHETVVEFNTPGKGIDMEITPSRGRLDLTNTKKSGSSLVKVNFFGESALVRLKTPGTKFTVDMLGRWAAGEKFSRTYEKDQTPTISVVLVVINGEIEISHAEVTTRLGAPPGPAQIHFNNHTFGYIHPENLDKLPDWISGNFNTNSPLIAARKASAEKLFALVNEKEAFGPALDVLAGSASETDRRIAIFLMGATDNLDKLWSTMLTLKTPDVLDDSVIALRHLIGREPGQDVKLWNYLVNTRKYTEGQADQTLDLLHSPSKAELNSPEYFEHLVLLLGAKRDLPRILANWHLVRLMPEGKNIGYNPFGSPESRKVAAAKWTNLIAKDKSNTLKPKGKGPSDAGESETGSNKKKLTLRELIRHGWKR